MDHLEHFLEKAPFPGDHPSRPSVVKSIKFTGTKRTCKVGESYGK